MFRTVKKSLKKSSLSLVSVACCLVSFSLLPGCTSFPGQQSNDPGMATVSASPFYPKDFREVLIPDGLEMNRDNTMFVKTESFNGGILSYEGRIEVNSLTEFFEKSMPQNGWRLGGSVKSKNVLLIFTKPSKTCMITIGENGLSYKTQVSIYIAQELQAGSSYAPAAPGSGYTPPPAYEEPLLN
ncbi:MAG: hypothetical protein BM485_09550 [Desulfobulbaceae bacterium DB1]|nr:MAG: hypothetical protein BM485_09550 [Desulfobulbaceae bacterium DB1]